jgi:hypothetical protein
MQWVPYSFVFQSYPPGLRWDPLRRLVQCSIDACLAESCPLDDGGNRLASLALLTSTLGECFFGWTVKRLLLRLFFVPFSFSNSVNGTRTKTLSWRSSRNLSVNLGTSGSSICASLALALEGPSKQLLWAWCFVSFLRPSGFALLALSRLRDRSFPRRW